MPTSQSVLTFEELCERLGLSGESPRPELALTGVTTLDLASPGDVSFLTRSSYRKAVATSGASLVLKPADLELNDPRAISVPDVWAAILVLIDYFYPPETPEPGIHPAAIVDPDAEVHPDASVGPFTIIEAGARIGARTTIASHCTVGRDVSVGEDCIIYERVTLASDTEIGSRVILHSGAVIGADGFKYEVVQRRLTKIPQVGRVVIEDDVEIGANSTIDRASFDVTRIGARTKIDNLVHIGHNCAIGSDCILVGQVGVAGSVKMGRGVVLGGQVGVRDNTIIGDGVQVAGQSGISGHLPSGTKWFGSPAVPADEYFKIVKAQRKLPELVAQLRKEDEA